MQGQAFLGPRQAPPRRHVFAARDRVDEEFETSRAVTDGRWKYIRNYTPHRPVLQHGAYSEVAAIWQQLRRLGRAEGDATRTSLLREEKPAEELYDLRQDPQELRNLAGEPAHRKRMDTMRGALHRWMLEIRDTGLLPEAEMMRLSGNRPPASLTEAEFPVRQAIEAAENVGRGAGRLPALRSLLKSPHSVVRYWACAGLRALNREAAPAEHDLAHALQDESPSVRIMAAEALVVMGAGAQGLPTLAAAVKSPDARVQLEAAAALWHLGPKAAPALGALREAMAGNKTEPAYQRTYFEWAATKTLERYR
jgi:HEAT repeat protein